VSTFEHLRSLFVSRIPGTNKNTAGLTLPKHPTSITIMHFAAILTVLTAAISGLINAQSTDVPVTGILGNATVVENNPAGIIYTATLPKTQFFNPADPRGNIKGAVSAVGNSNGIGVAFSVDLSNFPTSGGPFRMLSRAAQFNDSS
jgi:hypothetical protein